jgi:PAS domain S-box-containing protein
MPSPLDPPTLSALRLPAVSGLAEAGSASAAPWLAVAAEVTVASACLLVLAALWPLWFRRREPILARMLAPAGLFVLAFAGVHLLEACRLWVGVPRAMGAIKLGTASVALVCGALIAGLGPRLWADPGGGAGMGRAPAALAADLEEQRAALERLGDVEARFRLFVEGVKDYAICRFDPEGRVTTWNPGAERISGYPAEEILGESFARFYLPEDQVAGEPTKALEQAKAHGYSEQEGWRVRKDGSRFVAMAHITAIRNEEGGLAGFAQILRDITERRESEQRIRKLAEELERKVKVQGEELLESSAMVKGIIEYAPAAVALKSLEGRFLIVNPRMEALLGRSQADLAGKGNREIFPAELALRLNEREERVLGLRQAVEVEEQWTHSDGTAHDYLVHVFPLVDALGQCWGLGIIGTDITERRRADQTLLQSQKMESLGLLAGGIAHDFNNLLGAMQGNLDLAKMELAQTGTVPEPLRQLEGVVDHAARMVGQILTYAGRAPFKMESLDLNMLVEEMIHLLRASISPQAVIRYDPDPGLACIEGDASQIQQMVMNLVLNASEALGDSPGTITLRTGMEHLGLPYLRSVYEGQDLTPGPHVSLEVADTGIGMSAETRKRIFEPFFTTKSTGRGLGLSAIQGIIRSHRGGIRVYSEPGMGTQFKIVLPAQGTAPAAAEVVPEAVLEGFRGSGTVLVVDDEAGMRATAVKLLNHMGFNTIQAADGFEAIRILERYREGIRLILMDLTMPKVDGVEAYLELRRRGILVPVILTSGFHEREALRRFRGQGLAGFLQKPYKYNVLIKMVQASLEP